MDGLTREEMLAETIWFAGENGAVMTITRSRLTPDMTERLRSGALRRVRPDGSPWEGGILPPLPPPPLPEPDEMIIGTLRGYRYWSVSEEGLLTSARRFTWPPGEWAQASCDFCQDVPSQEPCRDYGYGCGLYAAYHPNPVGQQGDTWGVIEAKGRIIAHARGFRAQYARVIALGRGKNAAAELEDMAAARYHVPLLSAPVLMSEYAPDRG